MKLAVPTAGNRGLDEQVGEHFGRVPTYTVVDTDSHDVAVIANTSTHAGGTMHPPELLAHHGVDVLLCQGLGRRAVALFSELGIQVYVGATGTVRDALHAYHQGKLERATQHNACTQHAFRQHSHHPHRPSQ